MRVATILFFNPVPFVVNVMQRCCIVALLPGLLIPKPREIADMFRRRSAPYGHPSRVRSHDAIGAAYDRLRHSG